VPRDPKLALHGTFTGVRRMAKRFRQQGNVR
jgi:hypothetical protein